MYGELFLENMEGNTGMPSSEAHHDKKLFCPYFCQGRNERERYCNQIRQIMVRCIHDEIKKQNKHIED